MINVDSRSMPIFRILLLQAGILLAIYALLDRLWKVQVHESARYEESLRRQTTTTVLLPPARGGIYDRQGIGLAENHASYDIDVYLREMVGTYARRHGGNLPKTSLPKQPGREVVDVDRILQEMTGNLIEKLAIPANYKRDELLRHYDQSPHLPYPVARNLDFEALSRFAEQSVAIPGLQESARPARSYNFGAFASHILGYVGAPEEQQEDVYLDTVGREGIEKTFDSVLQGVPGSKILRKNHVGYILGVEAVQEPTIGQTLYLSIDARIQHIVETTMRKHQIGRGSCVIMDVHTGDILAMVSIPNYDPNVFIPSVSTADWERLTRDPTKPLHNRALSPSPPGSTFKTVVALAALANPNAHFTPNSTINCPPAIYHANRWWKDWYAGGRGSINLFTGLQWSCNTFFYQLSLRTGIDSIVDMAHHFGMGEPLLLQPDGTPLLNGEDPGIIPGPQWMKDREDAQFEAWKMQKEADPAFKIPRTWRERWSDGHTLNTSIGQGFTQVNPLQLTNMMSSIANGGTVYYPRLVRAIVRHSGDNSTVQQEFPVRIKATLDIAPECMEAVRAGLRAVVTSGTAQRANSPRVSVAGKTGTAQNWRVLGGQKVKDNLALFNGYSPADNPRYAMTMVIEGGSSGGRDTGPVIKEILETIDQMEKGTSLDMVYLTPALGHFRGVKSPAEEAAEQEATHTQTVEVQPDPLAPQESAPPRRSSLLERIFGSRRR